MNEKVLIIVVLVLVAIGLYFVLSGGGDDASTPTPTPTPTPGTPPPDLSEPIDLPHPSGGLANDARWEIAKRTLRELRDGIRVTMMTRPELELQTGALGPQLSTFGITGANLSGFDYQVDSVNGSQFQLSAADATGKKVTITHNGPPVGPR